VTDRPQELVIHFEMYDARLGPMRGMPDSCIHDIVSVTHAQGEWIVSGHKDGVGYKGRSSVSQDEAILHYLGARLRSREKERS